MQDEAKADAGPATAEVENPLTKHRVMAHFTPLALLASPRYQQWLHSLGPAWQHVVCYAGAGQKTTLMRASVLQVRTHTRCAVFWFSACCCAVCGLTEQQIYNGD